MAAVPIFTRATLRQDVLDEVRGKVDAGGATTVVDRMIDRAVRQVLADVDLRSTKRRVQLSISGRQDIQYDEDDGTYDLPTVVAIGEQADTYAFHCPTDLKGNKVIDLRSRTNRTKQYFQVGEEEFDRRKLEETDIFAISDNAWERQLRVTGVPELNSVMVHDCDGVTDNGTFSAVGGASSLATETSNVVEGDGAISFNSDLGSTTAGIQNSTFTAVDLSAYEDHDLFVWVYIPNASLITNFTLRWGSDASNYYQVAVTSTHDSLAFFAGWNLLRFSWADATATGTPSDTAIDFVSFFMTKDASKAAATGWIVDRIIAMVNSDHDVVYYSKYGWQTSAGVWLEEASDDADFVNADSEEYGMIVSKAAEFVSRRLGVREDVDYFKNRYVEERQTYWGSYPSEAIPVTTSYYNFGSQAEDESNE